MNTQISAHEPIAEQNNFNIHAFADNLGKVLRKLSLLYIQRQHNAEVTALLDGSPDPAFEDLAHERIAELEQMLEKINNAMAKFC